MKFNWYRNNLIKAWLCSILVIFSSLIIFMRLIYPIINNSVQVMDNINNLSFDGWLIFEEVCAYFLFILGLTLPGRSRFAWFSSVIILVIIFVMSIVNLHGYFHTPMIIISLLFLLVNYKIFDQQLYLSYGFVFITAFVVFALVYGSFGSYLLRSQFANLITLNDALYFTVVSFSTVGYGDIYPLTAVAKNFTISMIAMGLVMFTTGITLIAYSLNDKIKHVLYHLNQGKISMSNHIVFIGYGIFAKILIDRYHKSGEQYLVIDSGKNMDTDRQILQEQDKLMISPYPGNKDALVRARVSEAKMIIVCFDEDSETIFAIMNVAEYLGKITPRPRIIARVYYEENINKAKLAGADDVIAPHLMAADKIMSITHEKVT